MEPVEWRFLDENRIRIGLKGPRRFLLKKTEFGSMGMGRALKLETKHKDESDWKKTDFIFLLSGDSNGALKRSYKRKFWTLDGTEYSETDWEKIEKEIEKIAEIMY